MEEKKKYRIGTGMAIVLVCLAGFFDLTTLIPLVGDFVSPVFWAGMAWYLRKTGHGLVNWKTAVPGLISFVSEFIPVVQALPTILCATIVIIVVSRVQDKTGMSVIPGGNKPGMRLPDKPPPLNQNGMRPPRKV